MRHFPQLLISSLITAALLGGCSTMTQNPASETMPGAEKAGSSSPVRQARILVRGMEGGPKVSALIIEMNAPVERIDARRIRVETAGVQRSVHDAFVSDADGAPASGGRFVTVQLTGSFDAKSVRYEASPFAYNTEKLMNEWASEYRVKASLPDVQLGGQSHALTIDENLIGQRVSPDTAPFRVRSAFSGSYRNPLTGQEEMLKLHTAAYEPDHLKGGEKNPLVIWLHGQGEGGSDPDIVLLGNEAAALARDPIQSHFKAGTQQGAYVLVAQTPSYWMDEGDGTNGAGSGHSRYTGILMDTIRQYVSSNADVDPDRIYIGGDSNGGYMTMEMIIEHPDYFAAAYPICAAYAYPALKRDSQGRYVADDAKFATAAFTPTRTRWMTPEKVQRIRHQPIWFVTSADDDVVLPSRYSLPIYQALLQAGADNAWYSYFETVEGSDEPGVRYPGHFSWIYVLNDQVRGVQPRKAIAASKDRKTLGFSPSNASGGGSAQATVNGKTYDNLFAWMNDQRRKR